MGELVFFSLNKLNMVLKIRARGKSIVFEFSQFSIYTKTEQSESKTKNPWTNLQQNQVTRYCLKHKSTNSCGKANTNHKSCRLATSVWKEVEGNNRAIEGPEKENPPNCNKVLNGKCDETI